MQLCALNIFTTVAFLAVGTKTDQARFRTNHVLFSTSTGKRKLPRACSSQTENGGPMTASLQNCNADADFAAMEFWSKYHDWCSFLSNAWSPKNLEKLTKAKKPDEHSSSPTEIMKNSALKRTRQHETPIMGQSVWFAHETEKHAVTGHHSWRPAGSLQRNSSELAVWKSW